MKNFIFDLQKDYDFILDLDILFTNISEVCFAYIDALYAGELT